MPTANNQPPADDFFALLEKEKSEASQADAQEIIFRDQAGKMKVLKNGQIFDFAGNPPKAKIASAVLPEKKPALPIKPAPPIDRPVSRPLPPPMEEQLAATRPLPPITPAARRPVLIDLPIKQVDYQQAAEAVIKESGVVLSDADLVKRLKNVLISHLKNVRVRLEAGEILLNSPSSGGVGLAKDQTEKILDTAKRVKEKLEGGKFLEMPKKSLADLPVLNYSIPAAAPVKEPIKSVSLPAIIPSAQKAPEKILPAPIKAEPVKAAPKPILPPVAAKPVVSPSAPKINLPQGSTPEELGKSLLAEVLKETPVETLPPAPKANILPPLPPKAEPKFRAIISETPKTEPVKYQSPLVGPVEEIKTLKLVDFRRLSPDPKKAAAKILEKIDLLDRQSLTEKVKGVKAWKETEIYRLYLDLGTQAMEEKKQIAEVVAERQAKNLPTLTEAEMDAVIELNQKMRY
jgi:hypothetical protein